MHCQHTVCSECLSSYIGNQIDRGITCIECPQHKCKQLVDDAVIQVLSDRVCYARYRSFLQNAFLETSSEWKFCPNPSCCSAVKCTRSIALLACNCSTPLCTACMEKFHWPLSCRENKLWATTTKAKTKLTDPNLPALPAFEGQKYEMLVQTKPDSRRSSSILQKTASP